MEDSKIMELYVERSEKAIEETAKKYGRYCHYISFGILGNDEDAKECVNDTYLRTWNAIPPTRPNNFRTFLGKIVRNLSLNRYEKMTANKRGGSQVPLVLSELEECIPASGDTEQVVTDLVFKSVLNEFLKELPQETRRLFVRRYFYLSPVKELAKEFRMSESQVTVRLFRTREKLRVLLEKEGITL